MKRWIWLALLGVVMVGLLNWQKSPQPGNKAQLVQQSRPSVALPTVDAQRLLTDLEALTFNRSSGADRGKARRYIVRALEDAGWKAQEMPFTGKANGDNSGNSNFKGVNVYAERLGSDPAAGAILLGAHYDSVARSPGADDNATSVSVVLEAARLLSAPTPRTLKLLFFDLEELGLLGSEAFVADPSQAPLSSENFKGAVILDMVGYACHEAKCQSYPPVLPITPPTDRGDFLAVIGNQEHSELMNSFTQSARPPLPQVLTLAIPTLGGFTPDLVRSDHAPFWKNGLGAVLVTDTANFRNPHYHQPTDTLETIDQEFFFGSAQVVINAVTTLLQGND
jgi:Zn-dependent M28 family amino/carboxypeptidase